MAPISRTGSETMSGTSASRIKSRPQSAISSASRNQDRVAKKLSTAGVSDKLQRPSSAAASIRKDEIKLSLRMRVAGGPDLRKWLQRTGVKIQSDVSKETLAEIKTEFDLQDLSEKGTLSLAQCKAAMTRLKLQITPSRLEIISNAGVLDLATFTRAMIACGYGKRDALDDVYGPGALYAPGVPLVAAKDSEVPSLTLMHAKRERAFQDIYEQHLQRLNDIYQSPEAAHRAPIRDRLTESLAKSSVSQAAETSADKDGRQRAGNRKVAAGRASAANPLDSAADMPLVCNVVLIQAHGLPTTHHKQREAWVDLELAGRKRHTRCARGDEQPRWNEQFCFPLGARGKTDGLTLQLHFHVGDAPEWRRCAGAGGGGHVGDQVDVESVGTASIPLAELDGRPPQWVPMRNLRNQQFNLRAQLCLLARVVPAPEELHSAAHQRPAPGRAGPGPGPGQPSDARARSPHAHSGTRSQRGSVASAPPVQERNGVSAEEVDAAERANKELLETLLAREQVRAFPTPRHPAQRNRQSMTADSAPPYT